MYPKAMPKLCRDVPQYKNKYGQVIAVFKNPDSWRSNYSVWARTGRKWGDMLVSHHKTKALAAEAAKRLKNTNILVKMGWVK